MSRSFPWDVITQFILVGGFVLITIVVGFDVISVAAGTYLLAALIALAVIDIHLEVM